MARIAGKIFAAGSVAGTSRRFAQADTAAWAERAITRNRSDGGLGQNCGRFYRSAFGASCFARRNSLRARASTRVALRARASFKDRYPAKIEAALRRKNDPRHPISRGVRPSAKGQFFLLTLP